MNDDVIVMVSDARAVRFCMGGSRRLAARYGLSWDEFVSHGYPASVLAALDDPMVNRVVAEAYRRVGLSR